MPNEKTMIAKIMSLFKSKGIELNSEETLSLTDTVLDSITTAPKIEIPPINHNADIVKQLQDLIVKNNSDFESKLAAQQEQFNQTIKDLQDYAAKQKEEADKRQAVIDEQLNNDKKIKIETIIQDAIKAGKIEPENKERQERYKTLLETNFDLVSKEIESLPINSNVQSQGDTQKVIQGKPEYNKYLSIANPAVIERMNKQEELIKTN